MRVHSSSRLNDVNVRRLVLSLCAIQVLEIFKRCALCGQDGEPLRLCADGHVTQMPEVVFREKNSADRAFGAEGLELTERSQLGKNTHLSSRFTVVCAIMLTCLLRCLYTRACVSSKAYGFVFKDAGQGRMEQVVLRAIL